MRIVLVGQPNSGKSTLFNAVAGYKSATSNLAGTTSRRTQSTVRLDGEVAEILDFPGCYSLSGSAESEVETRDYLLFHHIDVVIDVVDASRLGQGLPLTLELMDIGVPVVLVLNMVDEAARRGIAIDSRALSQILGIPVVETIASRNLGVGPLFRTALRGARDANAARPCVLPFQKDMEDVVSRLAGEVEGSAGDLRRLSSRFAAIKLLEGNEELLSRLDLPDLTQLLPGARKARSEVAGLRGRQSDTVMTLERHVLARDIVDHVAKVHPAKRKWYDRLDDIVMHPLWGYAILFAVLAGAFVLVFRIGSVLEEALMGTFDAIGSVLAPAGATGIETILVRSALTGVAGGAAVVLPYIIPFLLVLALLEDVGYLPRLAFLMDSFMHRLGLHGTAIVPVILGYGCSVPAVMATRNLPAKRDRIIAATIVTLVPCSARTVVIMGVAAYYLGIPAAVAVYTLDVLVIAATGHAMSRLIPDVTPGMIMEMPDYRWPAAGMLGRKVWFRVREFVVIAWPMLIAGSVILGMAEWLQWTPFVDRLLQPLTVALGLPMTVGTVLVFGILRKELAPVMLMQAIGTTHVLTVLSPAQIMTFTVFITFYVPCVATIAALAREVGWRWVLAICGITTMVATALALSTRLAFIGFLSFA